MPSIIRLPQSLINKIAAGEVVERPASVVKELMENSVDAGATRIDVTVASGGLELVRVVDDGCGIPADQLPLAVASHATSKIGSAEDLFSVSTLGFRGEALASIAEVSRMVLRSRPPEAAAGAEIEVIGGQVSPVAPCGCPPGTTVEVRQLFFNTPVRRKFLRSAQTELGHTSEAFVRIALPQPDIHFTLTHNGRTIYDLPAGEGWLQRIARIFGRQLAEQLIWVESADGPVRIAGYVAHPSYSRSNNRMQYLFLNGRYIRDRSLQHALGEAYRGLLTSGRYPICMLALEMPPEMVDVNVHPTKLEVRFQDSGRLYSQLLSTLRAKFLSTDLTVRVEPPAEEDPTGAHDAEHTRRLRQQLVDWARGEAAAASRQQTSVAPPRPLTQPPPSRPSGPTPVAQPHWPHAAPTRPAAPADTPAPAAASQPARAIQVHNRYLIAESEDGVMVIDQHALHERILYEQLRERIEAGGIEAQSLLVPEAIDLKPAEVAAALEHRDILSRLGLRIEPFGGNTVLLSTYPAMLANFNPAEVIHGLLQPLLEAGKEPDQGDLLDRLLHTIACKAAVKAGDRLSPEEIHALLEGRHLVNDPHHCPHGRPAAVVFTREELDRHFKRT